MVVDTSIIDHPRGVPQAIKLLKERLSAVKELLGIFEHCPVDNQTAITAGSLLAKYRRSHGLEPMDALIVATARVNEAVLFTLNTRHFKYIEGLIAVNPYDAEV